MSYESLLGYFYSGFFYFFFFNYGLLERRNGIGGVNWL